MQLESRHSMASYAILAYLLIFSHAFLRLSERKTFCAFEINVANIHEFVVGGVVVIAVVFLVFLLLFWRRRRRR